MVSNPEWPKGNEHPAEESNETTQSTKTTGSSPFNVSKPALSVAQIEQNVAAHGTRVLHNLSEEELDAYEKDLEKTLQEQSAKIKALDKQIAKLLAVKEIFLSRAYILQLVELLTSKKASAAVLVALEWLKDVDNWDFKDDEE